ncbi:MAG: thioredoxin [Candidatus Hermodarchaeota archaeon]|nr:thioredoxin [Candidatus Hermodarchaeota archaeon]
MSEHPDPELARLREQKIKELKQTMTTQTEHPQIPQGVLHLSTQDFDQTISKGVTLVDFHAEWCGPCKMMAPVVDQLAKEYAGRAKVAKIDIDLNIEIAMRYRVQGVPTFGIFKDGQMVHRIVGGVGYQPLKGALDTFL